MAFTSGTVNVLFGGSETKSVAAGNKANSDQFSVPAEAVNATLHVKAENDSTPAAGDDVEVWLQRLGYPDGTGAYDVGEQSHILTVCDTNEDPTTKQSPSLPLPCSEGRLLFKNRSSGRSITVSAEIETQEWA